MSTLQLAKQFSAETGRSVESCRAALRRGKDPRIFYRKTSWPIAERRVWLAELKKQPCTDCGGVFPPECMDFHHLDKTTKSFSIGMNITRTRVALEDEISKCIILCANCHRIRSRRDRAAEQLARSAVLLRVCNVRTVQQFQ